MVDIPKHAKAELIRTMVDDWLEENKIDAYCDPEQIYKDVIIIRPGSADSLPMIIHEMQTGWELFVHGLMAFSETSLDDLRDRMKAFGDG